jgi:hypothetical protein
MECEGVVGGYGMGMGTFIFRSISAAMVIKDRAGELSQVDGSYCGTD